MNKKQYALMLVLALIAGLVGGVVSSQFLIGKSAFAEKKVESKRIIEAEEFRLVDDKGNLLARLDDGDFGYGGNLAVYHKEFKRFPIVEIGVSGILCSDYAGKTHAALSTNGLAFKKPHGISAELLLNPQPFLKLFDENGNPRLLLGATELQVDLTEEIRKRPISS